MAKISLPSGYIQIGKPFHPVSNKKELWVRARRIGSYEGQEEIFIVQSPNPSEVGMKRSGFQYEGLEGSRTLSNAPQQIGSGVLKSALERRENEPERYSIKQKTGVQVKLSSQAPTNTTVEETYVSTSTGETLLLSDYQHQQREEKLRQFAISEAENKKTSWFNKTFRPRKEIRDDLKVQQEQEKAKARIDKKWGYHLRVEQKKREKQTEALLREKGRTLYDFRQIEQQKDQALKDLESGKIGVEEANLIIDDYNEQVKKVNSLNEKFEKLPTAQEKQIISNLQLAQRQALKMNIFENLRTQKGETREERNKTSYRKAEEKASKYVKSKTPDFNLGAEMFFKESFYQSAELQTFVVTSRPDPTIARLFGIKSTPLTEQQKKDKAIRRFLLDETITKSEFTIAKEIKTPQPVAEGIITGTTYLFGGIAGNKLYEKYRHDKNVDYTWKPPKLINPYSPEFKTQYIKGVYEGVREEPIKTSIIFGTTFILPYIATGVSAGAKSVSSLVSKGIATYGKSKTAQTIIKSVAQTEASLMKIAVPVAKGTLYYGLPTAYLGAKSYELSLKAGYDYSKYPYYLGVATSTELVPAIAGSFLGLRTLQMAKGYFSTRGLKYIPREKITTEKVLTKKETFPTAGKGKSPYEMAKVHKKLFLKGQYVPKGEITVRGIKIGESGKIQYGEYGGYHATADRFWDVKTNQMIQVKDIKNPLHISYSSSKSFLGLDMKAIYGKDFVPIAKNPALLYVYPQTSKGYVLAKGFEFNRSGYVWLQPVKAGRPIIPVGGKSEVQAIYEYPTMFEQIKTPYYTSYGGYKIPFTERYFGAVRVPITIAKVLPSTSAPFIQKVANINGEKQIVREYLTIEKKTLASLPKYPSIAKTPSYSSYVGGSYLSSSSFASIIPTISYPIKSSSKKVKSPSYSQLSKIRSVSPISKISPSKVSSVSPIGSSGGGSSLSSQPSSNILPTPSSQILYPKQKVITPIIPPVTEISLFIEEKKRKKEKLKVKLGQYVLPDFTARIIGIEKTITTKQAKKLLKTSFTGLEIRPQYIIKNPKKSKKLKTTIKIDKYGRVKLK